MNSYTLYLSHQLSRFTMGDLREMTEDLDDTETAKLFCLINLAEYDRNNGILRGLGDFSGLLNELLDSEGDFSLYPEKRTK